MRSKWNSSLSSMSVLGFRETYGGLHLKYKVFPDIAIFGKALGNGYAITSIIGKKEVMEAAQKNIYQQHFLDRADWPKCST